MIESRVSVSDHKIRDVRHTVQTAGDPQSSRDIGESGEVEYQTKVVLRQHCEHQSCLREGFGIFGGHSTKILSRCHFQEVEQLLWDRLRNGPTENVEVHGRDELLVQIGETLGDVGIDEGGKRGLRLQ